MAKTKKSNVINNKSKEEKKVAKGKKVAVAQGGQATKKKGKPKNRLLETNLQNLENKPHGFYFDQILANL